MRISVKSVIVIIIVAMFFLVGGFFIGIGVAKGNVIVFGSNNTINNYNNESNNNYTDAVASKGDEIKAKEYIMDLTIGISSELIATLIATIFIKRKKDA